MLKPVVVRYKGWKARLYFRGDAAFASPEMYEYLEAEGFLYAIRLPTNQILQESIAQLLTRPVRNSAEITLQQLEPGITAVVIMSLEPTTRQFRVVSAAEAI